MTWIDDLLGPLTLRESGMEGETVRILACGNDDERHIGKVGRVIEAGLDDGPHYHLVRIPGHGDCMATSIDDPSEEGRD